MRWLLTDGTEQRKGLAPIFAWLILSVGLGCLVGLSRGSFRGDVLLVAKEMLLYLVPIAMAAHFVARRELRVLENAIVIAAAGWTFQTLVEVTLGIYNQAATEATTLGETVDASRIRPEVLNLVVVAFLLVVHRINTRQGLKWRLPALALFTWLLLVSFTRTTWLAMLVGLLVWAIFRSSRGAGRGPP